MDYARVYDDLMMRARARSITGYSEKHHMIPRCMGGPNSKANIVELTAREHVMAHKLLVRIYPGNLKLWHALMLMGRLKVPASRVTAREREEYAKRRREFRYSDESKAKMSESAKKRAPNGEATQFPKGHSTWNKGLKDFRAGYSHSEETRAKITTANVRNANKPPSPPKGFRWGKGGVLIPKKHSASAENIVKG